jgi:serine/threonine protein kinase
MHTTTIQDLSNQKSLQGSPRWMSPEQMSLGITNKTTDIYSFAMTIYEVRSYFFSPRHCYDLKIFFPLQVFTGAPPFPNTLDAFLFTAVVDRQLRPPRPTESSAVLQGLDDSLWALIEQCWSQEPTSRPVAASVAMQLSSLAALYAKRVNSALPKVREYPNQGIKEQSTSEWSMVNNLSLACWQPVLTALQQTNLAPTNVQEFSDYTVVGSNSPGWSAANEIAPSWKPEPTVLSPVQSGRPSAHIYKPLPSPPNPLTELIDSEEVYVNLLHGIIIVSSIISCLIC